VLYHYIKYTYVTYGAVHVFIAEFSVSLLFIGRASDCAEFCFSFNFYLISINVLTV